MPVYNEGEGISSFLEELHESLSEYVTTFILVNDCSLDSTADVVESLKARGFPVSLHTNDINGGHGPSTLTALGLGVKSGAQIVVSTDGDGQFLGTDVSVLVRMAASGRWDIVEGVRTFRTDPAYRKVSTATTRALVWSRARQLPKDADTPLRVYRRDVLSSLIDSVPDQAMTPNLLLSMLSRRRGRTIAEVNVRSIPRRGSEAIGATWGRGSLFPSKRFVTFCVGATREGYTIQVG
jgi:dolichol-phosphate mannosyltransferase